MRAVSALCALMLLGLFVCAAQAGKPALVLYDTTSQWAFLGEQNAISMYNLASHFGSVKVIRTVDYPCGALQSGTYKALLYPNAIYDEPLPACLITDVINSTIPVLWSGFSIWQAYQNPDFVTKFGWHGTEINFAKSDKVEYKNKTLARNLLNDAGILGITIDDAAKATVLATAVTVEPVTRLPWAVKSGVLTYIAESPFAYISEEDRYYILADLLFDVISETTPKTRHRAMVRLEDLSAKSEYSELKAIADYLKSQNVPFGFGATAEYRDPFGVLNDGTPEDIPLKANSTYAKGIKYLISKGGVPIVHGFTHQYNNEKNPTNGVTGDDVEFFRTVGQTDGSYTATGPVPEDTSSDWAKGRMEQAMKQFAACNCTTTTPTIFEFPHYMASVTSYQAAVSMYKARWERGLYWGNVLAGGAIDYSHSVGQMFPYVVRDVYGGVVLPESLGNIELEAMWGYPTRSAEQIINAANLQMVIRDNVACFFFHPFNPITHLQTIISGMKSLGYTFVSPNSLLGEA